MPQLRCLAPCGPAGAQYEAGRVYHFDEEAAARVMRGSPGSWELVEGVVRMGGPDEYVDYSDAPSETDMAHRVGEPRARPPVPVAGNVLLSDGDDDEDVDLDELSAKQLRAIAAERDVDVRGLRSKLELRNALERADTAAAAGGGGSDDEDENAGDDGDDEDADAGAGGADDE